MKVFGLTQNRLPEKPRTPWPLLAQQGFGLLEVLTAILVFVLIAYVATRAFHNVVDNHRAANQVTHMTDLVSSTAEELSAIGVAVLTQSGSSYLQWTKPTMVGRGPMYYRYRIVPKPTVGGSSDSTLAGLQLEAGTLTGGKFTGNRTFAALIAPHMASLNSDGKVSTEQERKLEAAFYAGLQKGMKSTLSSNPSQSQNFVNSYSCYDKGECCGFMKAFMADTSLKPTDGLNQKCHHRCALSGDVPMATWQKSCGVNFCSLAPWRTKSQCCDAINSGHCLPGSLCARICVECVGENGSTCPLPKCDGGLWNDLIDCKNGAFCDGSALPESDVPGWGYVAGICKLPTCQTLSNECTEWKPKSCCGGYWGKIAQGEAPDPGTQICATISKRSECCDVNISSFFWNFRCGSDGKIMVMQNGGTWYCAEHKWDKYCAVQLGCSEPSIPPGSNSGSGVVPCVKPPPNLPVTPWQDPFPKPSSGGNFFGGGGGSGPMPTSPPSIGNGFNNSRSPFNRGGGGFGSFGGRE